jgi:hypothetical protein
MADALRPSPDVLCRELEGEAVLLDLGSGLYFGLNAVGTRVWQLVEQGTPAEDIAGRIAEEYDAPVDVIARDVARLLDELRARGLLVSGPPTGSP